MAVTVQLSRAHTLPDPHRLARHRRAPEVGPRVLFFSGGSALAGLSRQIIGYTHNSIHLITPFDSGGSSALLRQAFNMLAVGDLRNRLMALTDPSVQGCPAIVELFAYRFPKQARQAALLRQLEAMLRGYDPLVSAIPDPMRKIVRNHLGYFHKRMPDDFPLAGASIGNLVLTGGFLNNRRHIDPVIFMFSKLAEVRGVVRPVITKDLHLAAELADGTVVVGQHNLTGKQAAPIAAPIQRLFLTPGLDSDREVTSHIRDKVGRHIDRAELIVFPMGSFYTSLMACLLPRGVGRRVAAAGCPKVYVPNTAGDPEMLGLDVAGSARRLLAQLQADQDAPTDPRRLMDLILVDTANGQYPGGPPDLDALRALGPQVLNLPLVSRASAPRIDPQLLAEALLSLV